MSNAKLFEELGINLKGKSSGEIKTTCPQCSETRGKNKKDPCLSVDIDEGVYNCHHCGFKGKVFQKKIKEYIKPPARLTKLSEKPLRFFEEDRKISNNTLLRFGITESTEWMPQFPQEVPVICFNYYRGEELVNIKFRGPKKSFKMAKDAELIFYNLDSIKDEETAVIVEGEIDCLTMHECGIHNAVSVPNGASKGQKLEYLDNCWESFENIKKVIVAVDNDEAGRSLRDELARRLGKEKCFTVEYPEGCKDSNEVLIKYGKAAVKELIENAKEWPLEGIIPIEDMVEDITFWYDHGLPKGARTNIPGFDDLLTFAPGQLTVITGIPGHGKDEFANYIMTSLARHEQWKWGVCGFEEEPKYAATKIIEKYAGKSFAPRINPDDRISRENLERSFLMLDECFSFINIQKVDVTMEGILKKAEELVKRKGIKGLIINPWNCLDHNVRSNYSETQYISEELTKLINFLGKYDVHGILIAHPTKMKKNETTHKYDIPTLYNISGSANFYNKTHNGICIYRDFETNRVEVHVQKVKCSWLGQTGWCSYDFNTNTRQYNFLESSLKLKPRTLSSLSEPVVKSSLNTPIQKTVPVVGFFDDGME